jgi:YrbI family 3-deoxy-D-manno-octulosonate 8-phosphate phosphatase
MDDYMTYKKEVLAIIPARGGSKGIPRKNIRKFGGHPLIAFSIAAGLQSGLITRVIVSTDDPAIADAAKKYGAEVSFMRPDDLAQDKTLDLPVFEHALNWLAENENYHPEIVVHLRPTTPLRSQEMVEGAIELLLNDPEADSVRGVIPSGRNPYKMWKFANGMNISPILEHDGVAEAYNAPRQSLPDTYWHSGQIDVIRPKTILENKSMTGERVLGFALDERFAVDIDTHADWLLAEIKLLHSGLGFVLPPQGHLLPEKIELIVLDFDGVLTDNRVEVDQDGKESVIAHRGDGMGIRLLKEAGFQLMILSTEENPVVSARAKKLELAVHQGIRNKGEALKDLLNEKGIEHENVIYVGNDVNDLGCFEIAGCAVAVADAHPEAISKADLILEKFGGYGVVRELCDIILKQNSGGTNES